MSDAKHTPGPWRIDESWPATAAHPDWRAIVSGYDESYNRMSVSGHIGEANARLIAAAPDLLDACEDALFSASPTRLEHPTMFAAWEKLSAAIAKAKGEA